jgi:hypothetical protein
MRKLQVLTAALVAALLVTGVALAAASPTVATGSATSIKDNSGVLNGAVNPNGTTTDYYFQWGLTTGYGVNGAVHSAGNGVKAVAVKETAGDLIPGTVYHYRLVATNAGGTTIGRDRTFKTAGHPPPGVTTGFATQLSSSGATLTGAVNPAGETTTYWFEWGATTAYGQQTAAQTVAAAGPPASVSGSLQGLLHPGTIYHYRLVASHGGANATSVGADASFMTYPSPRPTPGVSASTKPRHARNAPYVLTTTGRVAPPASIPDAYGCFGDVTIRFFRGLKQVGFNLAALQSNCDFGTQTVFRSLPKGRHGHAPVHLRVVIRFVSTPYLNTNRAAYEHITLG